MQVAQQIASNPSASLPNQIEAWGDLKAAYNLFARDEVTFEAIARPHWELTKQRATGRNLVIGDTTELDFGKHRLIRMKLSDYLPQLELLGTYTLSLQMLKLARKGLNRIHDLTVGQFYREVAKLGGFLGRKSDGDPGWITIWRGWEKLNTYVYVASKLKMCV